MLPDASKNFYFFIFLFLFTALACGQGEKAGKSQTISQIPHQTDASLSDQKKKPINAEDTLSNNETADQKPVKKPKLIEGDFRNNNKLLSFYGSTGQLLKKIDLRKENPYWDLPLPILKEEPLFKWYNIEKIDERDWENYFGKMIINHRLKNPQYKEVLVGKVLVSISSEIAAVAYPMEVIDHGSNTMGWVAIIHIYNSQGKIIQTLEEREYGTRQIELSGNSKYLASRYGMGYVEDLEDTDIGYRFFNVESGEFIYKYQGEGLDWGSIGKLGENKFGFRNFKHPFIIHYIIDIKNRTIINIKITNKEKKEKGRLRFYKDRAVFRKNKEELLYKQFKPTKF